MDSEATEKIDKLALAVVALSEAILCLPEAEEESLGHATKACDILAGFSCTPKRSSFEEWNATHQFGSDGSYYPDGVPSTITVERRLGWNAALERLKPTIKEIAASAHVQRAIDAHKETDHD